MLLKPTVRAYGHGVVMVPVSCRQLVMGMATRFLHELLWLYMCSKRHGVQILLTCWGKEEAKTSGIVSFNL